MIRKTVILFSLVAALLLAGLCSCKQEIVPEEPGKNELDSKLIEAETISAGTSSATLNAGVSGVSIPVWEVTGGYSNKEKVLLRVAFSRRELFPFRSFIASVDPRAFVTFTKASMINGEGFDPLTSHPVFKNDEEKHG